MEKKKVLFVTQEMNPYICLSEIADKISNLPKFLQQNNFDVRILMPKFGTINERRHRLHEVVRLSGINIIIDEDDYPLVIKVASLPNTRLQVYFLDNQDFYSRKYNLTDQSGVFFEDNSDRMIFFCKGVLDTVKKFGWPPDIIHCNGWMSSLIPMYLKTLYKDEAVFEGAHCIYSLYESGYKGALSNNFATRALLDGSIGSEHIALFKKGADIDLHRGAMAYADALINSFDTSESHTWQDALKNIDKPLLNTNGDTADFKDYHTFYQSLLEK